MTDVFALGIYKYRCKIRNNELLQLPDQLKMPNTSSCGILLELVMGKWRY